MLTEPNKAVEPETVFYSVGSDTYGKSYMAYATLAVLGDRLLRGVCDTENPDQSAEHRSDWWIEYLRG